MNGEIRKIIRRLDVIHQQIEDEESSLPDFELDDLKEQEKEIKRQITKLERQINKSKMKIKDLDAEFTQLEKAARKIDPDFQY